MTGQLGFEGMPRPLFACTPSRLATYEDCPRRYRMTYLDRPTPKKGPPWAHNSLGLSIHNALRAWWEQPLVSRTPERAGVLLMTAWIGDGFRNTDQSMRWRERARAWVEAYAHGLEPTDEPIGVERTVATKTQALAFSGRVDRLDERDGEVVVVDYKTGRSAPDSGDARGSRALALYALAARRTLRRPCRRVELHHVPSGQIAAWVHTEESLERHIDRAEAVAADIVLATDTLQAGGDPGELFPPRPGRHCGLCDFRKHCAEGVAVSDERQPWAVLDAAEDGDYAADLASAQLAAAGVVGSARDALP